MYDPHERSPFLMTAFWATGPVCRKSKRAKPPPRFTAPSIANSCHHLYERLYLYARHAQAESCAIYHSIGARLPQFDSISSTLPHPLRVPFATHFGYSNSLMRLLNPDSVSRYLRMTVTPFVPHKFPIHAGSGQRTIRRWVEGKQIPGSRLHCFLRLTGAGSSPASGASAN